MINEELLRKVLLKEKDKFDYFKGGTDLLLAISGSFKEPTKIKEVSMNLSNGCCHIFEMLMEYCIISIGEKHCKDDSSTLLNMMLSFREIASNIGRKPSLIILAELTVAANKYRDYIDLEKIANTIIYQMSII